MIVGATNLITPAVREFEYDSILLIHADTIKSGEISSQLLQPIGRRCTQVLDGTAGIQQIELLLHAAPELSPNPARRFAVFSVINVGSRGVPEAGDHEASIAEYPVSVDTHGTEAYHV